MTRLLGFGIALVGGVMIARRLRSSERSGPESFMARMLERMPPDSPPKLVMSILPRLQQQNDEIIALLREQNELLRRARP